MVRARFLVLSLALVLVACRSEDPRLPQQLYEEAIRLSQQGNQVEAKALMEKLSGTYPDTPAGQQASKDLYLIDALLHQDLLERQRQLRSVMKRVADSLARYKEKHGEYPRFLSALVPEYLEDEPETPWQHPFFYRPYVGAPIFNTKDRKGRPVQVFNTKLDCYELVCLGVDLQPGGDGLAADTLVVNGEFSKDGTPPVLPDPQPVR